ncbi:carboxypeptidase-like regulatory domain-containing protein [Oerskovia merdavium]|uniref:Carboxypeptidase regulatory-like domain-containing protein n=1 Tax=Oerskovia merdavium TaxID=2762227 RepID=A0ABR8TW44_9CELL|nr:carboxypeptidase-like regulatory domain-containing protein [Oerskovia merdavium]MBD7980002.1 hypothetical protein [Oerskovia merdavium]
MSAPIGYSPDDPLDTVDLEILADLARISAMLDPVPGGLVERSLFAITLAGLEAEVMELEYVRVPEMSVRGEAPPVEARTITFTAESLTVMITLSTRDDTRIRIDGWAAPAGELAVELHRPDGMVSTTTDEDGRFVFEDVAPGPASLLLRTPGADGDAVTTPIIEL